MLVIVMKNGVGIEKNEYKVFEFYQESANMGHANGIFNIDLYYRRGIGVSKDEKKAFEYYQKSTDLGHIGGTSFVAHGYRNGIGVKRDWTTGIKGKNIYIYDLCRIVFGEPLYLVRGMLIDSEMYYNVEIVKEGLRGTSTEGGWSVGRYQQDRA